jgi:hypothetical protein
MNKRPVELPGVGQQVISVSIPSQVETRLPPSLFADENFLPPRVPGHQDQLPYGKQNFQMAKQPAASPGHLFQQDRDMRQLEEPTVHGKHQQLRHVLSLDSDNQMSASRQMPSVVSDRLLPTKQDFVGPRNTNQQLDMRVPRYQQQMLYNDGYPPVDQYGSVSDMRPRWTDSVDIFQPQRRPGVEEMNDRLRQQQYRVLQEQQQKRYQLELSASDLSPHREPMYQEQSFVPRVGSMSSMPGVAIAPKYGQNYQISAGYDGRHLVPTGGGYLQQQQQPGRSVQPMGGMDYDRTAWSSSAAYNGQQQKFDPREAR